jgi:superfamily I DNA/RNA helicase
MDTITCICGSKIGNNKISYRENTLKDLIEQNNVIEKNDVDEYQKKFIESDIKDAIVLGNPGCGKTKTIIEYCLDKKRKREITKPSQFLIISFSKKAQLDFVRKGKLKDNQLFTTQNISTIHSLSYKILKKNINKTTEDISICVLACLKLLQNNNEFDLKSVQCLKNIKFIFVDEAQDINENQYNLIKMISLKLNASLILVGDPNQNIYQFQGGKDYFLLNHSTNIYFLNNNYRSSENIVQFCNYLRPHNHLPDMQANSNIIENTKPVLFCGNEQEIYEHFISNIKKDKFNLKDIAIIGPVKKSFNGTDNLVNLGLSLFESLLTDHKIKYLKHYDASGQEHYTKKDINMKEDHINLLTSHGSKGLEFKKVYVLNFHLNTMTKHPTKEEYNNFKYLWYVSLSRAINEMIIYTLHDKEIFNEIINVPKHLYQYEGKIKNFRKAVFNDEIKKEQFFITDLLNDNKYFNEDALYDFSQKFKYEETIEKIYDIEFSKVYEEETYSTIFGIFIEEIFTFYYYKNKNNLESYVRLQKSKIQNIIFIEEDNKKIYNKLVNKGVIFNGCFMYNDFYGVQSLTKKEYDFLYIYCKNKLKHIENIDIIYFYVNNITVFIDNEHVLNLCDMLLLDSNYEKIIFDIIIYFYQLKHECKDLMNISFDKHLEDLKKYFDVLNTLSIQCPDNFIFQSLSKNIYLPIIGATDILHDDKIIELKFVNQVSLKHFIQVLLYRNNKHEDILKPIEIWNFKTGLKHIIKLDSNITKWNINIFLCDILKMQMNNNVFMLDLETNTINENIPFIEPSNTEIIDRCFYEYGLKSFVSNGFVKNKYPLTTTHINHITENDLINANSLNDMNEDMKFIFKYCLNPVFIAHNGFRFDFKIMDYHFKVFKDSNKKLMDCMKLLRLFVNCESSKLIDIYNKTFHCDYVQEHQAKSDVILMIKLFEHYNVKILDIKD